MAIYTGDGCAGRCDAKCYNAWEPECHCICQGGNHGVGRQEAIDNTRELAASWLERAQANRRDIAFAELAVGHGLNWVTGDHVAETAPGVVEVRVSGEMPDIVRFTDLLTRMPGLEVLATRGTRPNRRNPGVRVRLTVRLPTGEQR
jgi:hypothetical protein